MWTGIDLHLHSPGVATFICPDGADLRSVSGRLAVANSYAEQLSSARLSVCALTDYNGVRLEWFEPIARAAADRGITLLPGAELSFRLGKHGLHVLAIFSHDTPAEGINAFVQSLDRDAATPLFKDRSYRDIDPKRHIADSLNELRERFRPLLIFPHPDQDNGLCKSLQLGDAARLISDVRPDAIEHCSDALIQRLKSTGVLTPEYLSRIAFVEFSDAKRLADIGAKLCADGSPRRTYLKLSSADVDALRLALHDPATRLVLGSVPPALHARIRSLEVQGSGFLGNLTINWNDDLSAIIGGRGTGKSAIVETLRYSLGVEPYSEAPYRNELVHFALGSGGKAITTIDLPAPGDGRRSYQFSRVWGERVRVTDSETDRPLSLSATDVFGLNGVPLILGQREIYAVSGSEDYRLRLLDDLIGDEARERHSRVQAALEQLRANTQQILQFENRLLKRDELVQRLKTIEHEIQLYERFGVASKLAEATALRSDEQQLALAADALREARDSYAHGSNKATVSLNNVAKSLARGKSRHKQILFTVADVLNSLSHTVERLSNEIDSAFADAVRQIDKLSGEWKTAIAPLTEELNRIKREIRTDVLDPDRLIRLSDERNAIVPSLEEYDRITVELSLVRQRREQLLASLRERRHEEHTFRRERAVHIEDMLRGRLRLDVDFKGQKEEYKRQLAHLLKGSGVSADAVERLAIPDATDGAALAEAILMGPAVLQDAFGLTTAMAQRLIKWFIDNQARLLELESVIPADTVTVSLKFGTESKSLERLSPGQRATAILLLLFAMRGRILVLDQPEDDLDNRFVYEDVVQIIREHKGLADREWRRQIVTATHNPNIPVLGDAELVLSLESVDGRVQVAGRASIDDATIRETIKTVMEGGDEAFQRRAEKYGGL